LNSRAGGFQNRAGASYGKKIGFDDDDDDDYLDELEDMLNGNGDKQVKQGDGDDYAESDWDDDYGL